MSNITFYNGQGLLSNDKKTDDRPDSYLPSPELVKAVQYAQVLGRPLLVKGEPGCGKSKLAEAIAYELFRDQNNFRDYYFEWNVKSSSKAQDGLYVINHLERLQEANNNGPDRKSTKIVLPANKSKGEYIELGALGKVFQLTNTMDPALPAPVLLIDEIDKADIDFPNDLLQELDKAEFVINEAKDEFDLTVKIKASDKKKPLIIITSNDEKSLPPAFLRRCLFFYIDFPGPDDLFKIVKARNFGGIEGLELESATRLFSALRAAIEAEGTASKNITTSELIDWIRVINFYYQKDEKLFDIGNISTVSQFLNQFNVALVKDDATRAMLSDTTKSAKFLQNVIDNYKKFEDANAKK